jgi:hypothetical protein
MGPTLSDVASHSKNTCRHKNEPMVTSRVIGESELGHRGNFSLWCGLIVARSLGAEFRGGALLCSDRLRLLYEALMAQKSWASAVIPAKGLLTGQGNGGGWCCCCVPFSQEAICNAITFFIPLTFAFCQSHVGDI